MRNVLVLGGTGMVGQGVLRVLAHEPSVSVWGTYRTPDHRRFLPGRGTLPFHAESGEAGIRQLVDEIGGCFCIINCIAALKSEIDENSPESIARAELLNTAFPLAAAEAAADAGSWMIHLSTDGVFASGGDLPLTESVPPDASDAYGRTKRLGEPDNARTLTIRSSFIGPDAIHGKGLYEWFRRQPAGSTLQGFVDVRWCGATTLQFGECCRALLTGDNLVNARNEGRIHHFCPNAPCSKYDLLEIFKRIFNKDVLISPVRCPSGPQHRILGTEHALLRDWCGVGRPVDSALDELGGG